MTWQGYFVIKRITANLNEANWVLLIDELNQIVAVGDRCEQLGNIKNPRHADDGFYHDTGEVDGEGEPILKWYGNAVLYAANFNEEAVSFTKFQNRLVNLFGVPSDKVTYLEDWNPVEERRYRPSVIATYKLNANGRITVQLMGCASDSELCTKQESNQEVLQLLADNPVEWGEAVI